MTGNAGDDTLFAPLIPTAIRYFDRRRSLPVAIIASGQVLVVAD